MCRLLVADDQPHILEAIQLLLKPKATTWRWCRTPALVLEAMTRESFDAVLIDLNYTRDTTSGQEGLELVARIRRSTRRFPSW